MNRYLNSDNQVILKKDSVRNTCGLCGNNNKDPNDEFFARFKNDSPVSSINAFGNRFGMRNSLAPSRYRLGLSVL